MNYFGSRPIFLDLILNVSPNSYAPTNAAHLSALDDVGRPMIMGALGVRRLTERLTDKVWRRNRRWQAECSDGGCDGKRRGVLRE